MLKLTLILTVILPFEQLSSAFQPQRVGRSPFRVLTTRIESTTSASTANDDNAIQWELFRKYHLGKWKGVWTTYNYMGDVDIETIASVNVVEQTNEEASSKQQEPKIVVTHDIVKGAKTSDCTTCFDDYEIQSIPVATYTPGNLGKARLGACGMVVGPTVLRSGASKWIAPYAFWKKIGLCSRSNMNKLNFYNLSSGYRIGSIVWGWSSTRCVSTRARVGARQRE